MQASAGTAGPGGFVTLLRMGVKGPEKPLHLAQGAA